MDYENQLEHFSLRWNNYNDNMKTGFHDLLRREDFVDVTIAAEGKLIQAHKMVLSICSPYFKDIFKANPCQHPVVFLKDVTHKELSSILQFMYLGEVSVQQEELGRFLKTAEALKIKGLTSEDNEEKLIKSRNVSGRDQKELTKFNNLNKGRTKIVPVTVPEKAEEKRGRIHSTPNGITKVHSPSHDLSVPEETAINYDCQDSALVLKNEPPELEFYDIECDQVYLREENSGISESQMQDNMCDLSDDVNNSPHNPGNNPGSGKHLLNSVKDYTEAYKHLESTQGMRMSPVLTKNQGLCPICGRILQHKKNLQTHIADQHSGIFRCWPCQICHKVCKTWSALRVHTNRHHTKLDSGNAGPLPSWA